MIDFNVRGALRTLASALLLLTLAPFVRAEEKDASDVFLEQLVNNRPSFVVHVEVNRKDRIYQEGDTVEATVRSSKDGYLYLFNRDVKGDVYCLFPNQYQKENKIRADQAVTVPPADKFKIRVGAPFGTEVVKAVVTTKPLDSLEVAELRKAPVSPVSAAEVKTLYVEVNKREEEDWQWAEHSVEIRTTAKRGPEPPRQRIGLFIGISFYESPRVPRSLNCRRDAEKLAERMKQSCDLDECIVLVNKDATYEAIRDAICKKIAKLSRDQDTIFLFFSCQGGRYHDAGSGWHDYLLPYDVKIGNPETTISDSLLTRWLQYLPNRKVAVLLDTCYSRGALDQVKTLVPPFFGKLATNIDTLAHYGEEKLCLLAPCRSHQRTYVRKERDHGVLTYYLLKHLEKAPPKLSLKQWHTAASKEVRGYVEQAYRAEQDPVLTGTNPSDFDVKPAPTHQPTERN